MAAFLVGDVAPAPADPPQPQLSINDVTQNEGNSGTTSFVFTVTRSGDTSGLATVNYATADNSASGAPSCAAVGSADYVTTSGTLTFNPGDTAKTVTVMVCGDTTVEPNETFFVNLSGAAGATISDSQGVGTIVNDDGTSLSINDVTQSEGNSGTTSFVFTVSRSGVTSGTSTVNYATGDDSATGGPSCSAPGDVDYTPTNGILTFNPGDTSKTITVMACGDTTVEPNETFFVNLSGATGATITDSQGVGTILDDDSNSTLAINDVSASEGNSGTTSFVFTVTRSGDTSRTSSVNYATADDSATGRPSCAAILGADYITKSGTLTFNAGVSTETIIVMVCGDTSREPNETFFVNLSGASGAIITDSQGVGTILDDDTPAPSPSPPPSTSATSLSLFADRHSHRHIVVFSGHLSAANPSHCAVGGRLIVLFQSTTRFGRGQAEAEVVTGGAGGYRFRRHPRRFLYWHAVFRRTSECLRSTSRTIGVRKV